MSDQLYSAIILTLAYSEQFAYPLTVAEISQRLISQKRVSLKLVAQAVQELIAQEVLVEKQGYVFLSDTSIDLHTRLKRFSYAQSRRSEFQSLAALAAEIPWIKALAITGSMAMDNLKSADDDIDVMVITQPGRLYLARIWLIFLAIRAGKKSWWGSRLFKKNKADPWCFNLWLTTDSLAVPAKRRNLYSAYEVCQAKFIYDIHGCQTQWLRTNSWVKKWLANYWQDLSKQFQKNNVGGKKNDESILFDVVEKISFFVQRYYLQFKLHLHQGFLSSNQAFMHLQQRHPLVKKYCEKRLTKQYFLPREIMGIIEQNRQLKKKIVLVTGVFDLLHQEHRAFLQKAKQAGDELIVGVESDARVKIIKGPDRPIQNQTTRVNQIKKLELAAAVFILPPDMGQVAKQEWLIRVLQPDLLAVSAHTQYQAEKRRIVEKYGGKLLVVHEHNPQVSTTKLVKRK